MAGTSMVISVKNNLKLLSKRDRLKNRLGGYSLDKITEYNLPKATDKQLNAIAKRLKEERKTRMTKVVIITTILFLGLLCAFLYSSNGIVELLTY
ncbi:hypothetical protein [Winogradskyella ouciana]|uniref:hypothetical protein n=1 Tax=Winogradskyella ouciana TaxID=2608631 RepID=UPI003D26547D